MADGRRPDCWRLSFERRQFFNLIQGVKGAVVEKQYE
jgi:hypothetical protein